MKCSHKPQPLSLTIERSLFSGIDSQQPEADTYKSAKER
jgi:hypothetical protein